MKSLSIKSRVTLWYTTFMVIIVTIMLVFILAAGDSLSRSSAQTRLIGAVEDSFEEIEMDAGKPEIDDDLDFFQNGVYISVYGNDGGLLYGRTPTGFDNEREFISEQVQRVDNQWQVYDLSVPVQDYGNVWVRGVATVSELEGSIRTMIKLTLVALPFLVIIAGLGGYNITKRAFAPVRRITEAADKIGSGNDLSERIDLGKGSDEIYALAATFDHMFERLEQSFETERQFTSDASHELRTPTSVIISQCEYAVENAGSLDEAREALQVVLVQAKKMSRLISRLLTLARTDSGDQKLELESINLSEIAELVVEEQGILAAEKGIEIDMQIEPGIVLRADQTLMMGLLINLISNAVRYGKEDGHVWVKLERKENLVHGSVRDDGIGISSEEIGKIWNRFYQVDAVRSGDHEGGAGLGLSMVKWIVRAHGGKVFVESVPGEGSTFYFEIPLL